MKGLLKEKSRAFSLFTLIFVLLCLFLKELSWDRGIPALTTFGVPMMFLALGLRLKQKGPRRCLGLGAALVGWFVVSRMLLGEHYLEDSQPYLWLMCAAYLTALPFAEGWDADGRRRCLKAVCAVFGLVSSAAGWLGVMSVLTGRAFGLTGASGSIYVEKGRLYAFGHPNMGACVFLLGLICLIYLALTLHKKWFIPVALLLGAGLWLGLAFTVSRTAMLQWAAIVAGAAFLLLWRSPIKSGWLRAAAGLAAAVIVLVLAYQSFSWAVNGVTRFVAQAEEAAQSAGGAEIAVRPLKYDLQTMTGRTAAYKGFFQLVEHRPRVLALGVLNKNLVIELNRYIPHDTLAVFHHAHNAFIQITLHLGLPGLLIALWLSFLTVRSAVRILLLAPRGSVTAAEGLIPLACMGLLIATVSEVYLFTDQFPICNFMFLLLLGYALQTEKRLLAERSARA